MSRFYARAHGCALGFSHCFQQLLPTRVWKPLSSPPSCVSLSPIEVLRPIPCFPSSSPSTRTRCWPLALLLPACGQHRRRRALHRAPRHHIWQARRSAWGHRVQDPSGPPPWAVDPVLLLRCVNLVPTGRAPPRWSSSSPPPIKLIPVAPCHWSSPPPFLSPLPRVTATTTTDMNASEEREYGNIRITPPRPALCARACAYC
jgi:hypothetical protein